MSQPRSSVSIGSANVPGTCQKMDDSEYMRQSDNNKTSTTTIGQGPQPASAISQKTRGLVTNARVNSTGRIDLSLDSSKPYPKIPIHHTTEVKEFAVDANDWKSCPPLSIVILIVGSRGDVQPYIALGKRLKADGHRVRVGTHETFREFVVNEGLEFYNIGGDPKDLMSYMVRNPGLIPSMTSLANGDIRKKRAMLEEMIYGCWKACYAPAQHKEPPFVVDAIISNPPTFAHIHCAEALGIPLQMTFTMPWTPTTAFPQPLVDVNRTSGLANYLTYKMADLLTWQGTEDIINKLRQQALGLEPLSIHTGPEILSDLKVPWTYCMSPALVPKPEEWKNNIDIVGFYFLDLASNYEPPRELVEFLNAGDPPIYVGFGSIVVDDPQAMTKMIFDATAEAGVRALVSAGWGGLGGVDIPPHIFILGNIPHDWLFDKDRVAAVIHHGGAGTTAIGLEKGRPTVVVPFFGDQAFWGSMISQSGAGPEPIPHKELTVDLLREGILYALSPKAKEAAKQIAEQIKNDNGVVRGVESFYRHLPLLHMRCDLEPSSLAVWWSTRYCLKLSALAAQTLADAKLLDMKELDLHRTKEYEIQDVSLTRTEAGTDEVESLLWSVSVSSIATEIFRPVKGVLELTSAVPRGIMKKVGNVIGKPESSNSGSTQNPSPQNTNEDESEYLEESKKPTKASKYPIMYSISRDIRKAIKNEALKLYNSGAGGRPAEYTEALPSVELRRRNARVQQGLDGVKSSNNQQRMLIIQKFHTALEREILEARSAAYVRAAKKKLEPQPQTSKKEQTLGDASGSGTPAASASVLPEMTTVVAVAVPETRKSETRSPLSSQIDWDAVYEKDLDLAMKLSMEEGEGKKWK